MTHMRNIVYIVYCAFTANASTKTIGVNRRCKVMIWCGGIPVPEVYLL